MKKDNDCPDCNPNRDRNDFIPDDRCTAYKPLLMVIPPGGVHLDCPVHPKGHHIYGPPRVTC